MTASAPHLLQAARPLAAELEVAITPRAEQSGRIGSAKIDTAHPRPWICTMSPALMLPISTSACQAVRSAQGRVAPLLESEGRPAAFHDAVLLQPRPARSTCRRIAPAHGRGHRRPRRWRRRSILFCMKHPATRSPVLIRLTPGANGDHFARAVRQWIRSGLGAARRILRLDSGKGRDS